MANTAKKSTRKNAKSASRIGRPSNAVRAQRDQSETVNLISVAAAAYATGMANALGIDPGQVQTVGMSNPANVNAAASGTSDASQSQTRRTTSTSRKNPGRKIDPTSKMSLTRQFYEENLKLPADQRLDRASLVKAAAKKFKYTPQTANTYISNIERDGGRKLARRGTGSARGRARSTSTSGQSTGTAG